ncbi:MAG TPA: Ig-like domain-containing protein, partial [Gemmatimonadales bacterium]|nr:Ig-like domain-containing protein [Gemmatimonadales bacterium]
MNFRFKLSKRLAIVKAALATSVVLALACERDLTDPKLSHSSPGQLAVSADLTPFPVASVVASASANDSTLPQNTLDQNLATRWSAQGDGQWIRYDLGALVDMDRVAVAWYLGDTRIAYFDIEVSWDAIVWWSVLSGQSSGQTLQPEIHSFRRTTARYVRIVGHGNGQSAWNSITEVAIVAPTVTSSNVPVAAVTVNPASTSVAVGATVQLAAVTQDSAGKTLTGRSVTWTISNSAVATVAASGLVTGVATGTATITATSEGKSGTAAISVTAPNCLTSAGIWRNSPVPTQTGAFEAQFDATAATASTNAAMGLSNGPAADWTNLAAIVRFNSTGTIDARNGGDYAATTAIPYTAGTSYHFRLDVDLPSHTYDIYVTPAGATEQLLGKAFALRTEQAGVPALNNLGLDTNGGSATVCNVTVGVWTPLPPAPVASMTMSPAATTVSAGATVQLTATLKDASGNVLRGRSVTWASSAPALAPVSGSGLVTGLVVGTATITATSGGQTGSAAVTVTLGSTSTPLYTLGTGTNYYVAPSGSDGNPCTASAPCYTMARVSQVMSPGDNAHFASGNYTWSYSGNKVTKSGTAAAPISYISDTKWGAKVYGSGCDPIWNSGDYVQIINFDVTGNCSEGIGVNGNY